MSGRCESEHSVKFYETDTQLSETVVPFLLRGLSVDDGAVVIATAEHTTRFRDELTQRGIDTHWLESRGKLEFVDARSALDGFSLAVPRRTAFREAIEPHLDAAQRASSRSRVRVYGEMVSLLARDSKVDAALALEDLWNDLLWDRAFRLLCSFDFGDFARGSEREHLLAVCERHEKVIPAEPLDSFRSAQQLARRFVSLEHQTHSLREEVRSRNLVDRASAELRTMSAVGRLASGVAHEFNNLLTVISGYAEILLSKRPSDSRQRSSLEQIGRAADAGASLTRDLVALSGGQRLELQKLDVNVLVNSLRGVLDHMVGENIHLEFQLDEDAGCVLADSSQIARVLLELVTNSRDAMDSSGRIDIVSYPLAVPAGETRWSPLAPGNYVVIEIRDDGPGVEPDVADFLFEPFFTVEERAPGAGLGLAVARGIARQSRGWVFFDSEHGEGATLRVVLPRVEHDVDTDSPAMGSPARSSVWGGLTILVVEDDPSVRELIEMELRSRGHFVLSAENAESAETAASTAGSIDVLISDVLLPGRSGPRLAESLATKFPGLPVVFISGYADALLDKPVHGVSRMSFLGKPFRPSDLWHAVVDVLSED